MKRTEPGRLLEAQPAKARRSRITPRRRAAQPKLGLTHDQDELTKTIDQIKEEVKSSQGSAAAIKTKLEELAGTAISELNRVKELSQSIVGLYENNQKECDAETPITDGTEPSPGPAADSKEQWSRALGQEFEKLLITRKILEAMLPVAAEAKKHLETKPEPNGAKKILVVDDDLTTVKVISHFLEREDYLVSTSLSGVDGLQKALQEAPDLILLDIMIPDLDGFQFLSIFRKCAPNPRVPVVIISSLAEETEVLKGLEIGAIDYITKPFSPQILMAKIKKNLNSGP
jgi:CheY-like chemotaxis protein